MTEISLMVARMVKIPKYQCLDSDRAVQMVSLGDSSGLLMVWASFGEVESIITGAKGFDVGLQVLGQLSFLPVVVHVAGVELVGILYGPDLLADDVVVRFQRDALSPQGEGFPGLAAFV